MKSEQVFFSFDDEPEAPAPAVPHYSWNWWDPWPANLSLRECFRRQIARDRRAIEEGYEDETLLFRDRIASLEADLKEMDGDRRSSQQTPPAAAPRG